MTIAPVIDTWTEIVDRLMYVAHARVSETWRGQLFAASTFVLLTHDTPRHRGGVHRFGMPPVGAIRDLQR